MTPSHKKLLVVVIVALALLGLFFWEHESITGTMIKQTPTTTTLPTQSLTLGTTVITVEIAATGRDREQGLSGRLSLAPDYGMLFIFSRSLVPRFWMKDMHFSLDMIWIDARGVVVDMSEHVAPGTYPQTFSPHTPVVYVLEVPAGFVKTHAIAKGTKMLLQ